MNLLMMMNCVGEPYEHMCDNWSLQEENRRRSLSKSCSNSANVFGKDGNEFENQSIYREKKGESQVRDGTI